MTTLEAVKPAKKTKPDQPKPAVEPVAKPTGQAALVAQFIAARRRGVPLVAVTTPDPAATIDVINKAIAETKNGDDNPQISWDIVRGLRAYNKAGKALILKLQQDLGDQYEAIKGQSLFILEVAERFPAGTVLYYMLASRWLGDPTYGPPVIQAVWNLREVFKADRQTLVLLSHDLVLPPELQGDVVILDEPLPQGNELRNIVLRTHENAGVPAPNDESLQRAIDAIQGLPAFAAEQVTAMSLSKTGLDLDALWERKRKNVEQTPGLSVSREGVTFDDLGGLGVIKQYLRDLCNGNDRPNAVVFVDEIEKMLAGSEGDLSGTTQDQLGTILSEMQDGRALGVILCGHPGSGKSAIAKAAGNDAGIPTIKLDLGAAKGSLVGQSEAQLRTALKVIKSVSNGKALWIATCNRLQSLPPELRRRFKCGLFFFDLPDETERASIWAVHRAKWHINAADRQPEDDGWTGAEIEQCCELAWRLAKPLSHAAKFVVPICRSASDRIESLRQQADGKWLSASYEGPYLRAKQPAVGDDEPVQKTGRKMQLD